MKRNILMMLLALFVFNTALVVGRALEIVPNVVIQSIEGDPVKLEVQFNPKEITIDKQVPWQKHKATIGDSPALEFTAGEPKTLSCELMFDMFEERGDVHATYVSKLEKMALIDDTLKRPPMVTFTWGNVFSPFQGVVEDLSVKYTLFLPDGTPTRAVVSLRLKETRRAIVR
jgi:hypothetical protein